MTALNFGWKNPSYWKLQNFMIMLQLLQYEHFLYHSFSSNNFNRNSAVLAWLQKHLGSQETLLESLHLGSQEISLESLPHSQHLPITSDTLR